MKRTSLHRLRRLKRAMLCGLVRGNPGLQLLLPTATPLDVRRFCSGSHDELMVFLPGIGDLTDDFELNGFIAALRDSTRPADMAVADTHLGYYLRQSIVERLREDVIKPAKSCGHTHIHLVGTSLGGLGALLYAMEHPADVQGLTLLAPYLGEANLMKEITVAGGLRHWNPSRISVDDHPRKLWRSLKECAAGQGEGTLRNTYLGFGDRDRFAAGNAVLAEILPKDNVFIVRGGHDWQTWKRLWHKFLTKYEAEPQDCSHRTSQPPD